MTKPYNLAGLDIGTSNIKIVIINKKKGESSPEVVFQAQEPSFGVKKGVVVDTDKAARAIQLLLNRIRAEGANRIDSVLVNIGGSHVYCTSSRGMVAVSRADQRVSEEDVERLLQEASRSISLSLNKEIIEYFPRELIVDGQGGIKEAVGMQGGRLETEILALTCFSPYKKNLIQAVQDSDLELLEIVPSPVASSLAVLTPKQKELGVAVLDIGAGTSELAVFEDESLIHLAIFPIGSANITNDIAIGLRTDIDTAELIKINSGTCFFNGKDKKEKIETADGEKLVFSHRLLSRIIEARVAEIFDEVQKELKKISKQGLLPAGIVLTGGGSKIPKIVELAKKEFKLPCRLGKPMGFSGLEEDPAFSTACGLIVRGIDLEEGRGFKGGNWPSIPGGKIWEKIKQLFRSFIP